MQYENIFNKHIEELKDQRRILESERATSDILTSANSKVERFRTDDKTWRLLHRGHFPVIKKSAKSKANAKPKAVMDRTRAMV